MSMLLTLSHLLILLLSQIVSSDTEVAHVLTEGTWRTCRDVTLCAYEPTHCPQDRVDCCRSCLDQCETKGGEEPVDVEAYEALTCTVSHEIPSDWTHPSSPFILSVFGQTEAEELLSWDIFENADNVQVKVMNRPLCGSNFQDASASFVEVDLSQLAKVVQSAHGDGAMGQLRMMRFRKQDAHRLDYSHYTGEQLAFWEERTTVAAGDFAETIYQMLMKNPKFMYPLNYMGLRAEDDYEHARYSAIWMSTAGSRTGMHFDPWPSILYQFQGTKHVLLGPPDDEAFLPGSVNVGYPHTMGGGHLGHFPESSRLQSCLLRPGEFLYIPPGWRHDIFTVTSSVSVGIRLPQWSEEQIASSNIIKQHKDRIAMTIVNRRNVGATLFWVPDDEDGSLLPIASGKLKPTDDSLIPSRETFSIFKEHSFKVEFGDGQVFGPFSAALSDGFYVKTSEKKDSNGIVETVSEVELPLFVSITVENCPAQFSIRNVLGHEFPIKRNEDDGNIVEVLARYGDVLKLACGTAVHRKLLRVTEDKQNHLARFNDEM